MRTTFHQFFRPTKDEMDALLEQALICYDANVLLNVYRYSDETQNGLIEVFKTFAERTRLPHQVALEYARNRVKTIIDQVKLCQETEAAFKKVVHDYIEPKNKQPFLSERAAEALKSVTDELQSKRKALECLISEDHYADLLLALFEKRIGAPPDEKTLEQLHEQAKERYEKKTPPGYSDLKDKKPPRAYGDYIAWRQLMDIATNDKKDIILVIDDTKEDWWLEMSGKTVGPRPELLEEFVRETGKRVWLFSSNSFLIATNKAGSAKVADSVIEEVRAHHVAQRAALISDLKLSGSADVDGFASQAKLSSPRIDDALELEALAQYQKVTAAQEENKARPEKKMEAADEDEGGEE